MIHNNVIYMNLTPYNYYIKYSELCNSFYSNNLLLFKENNKTFKQFYDYVIKKTNENNVEKITKTDIEKNIEIMVSNHIIRVIENFFKKDNHNNFTKKNKITKNKSIKY